MVKAEVKDDIFETEHKHIAFAVNAEGINDSGFAGAVARRVWGEIGCIGPSELGTSYSLVCDGISYHALVCHSLKAGGWDDAPDALKRCLDGLDVPEGETIAIVRVGAGPVGQIQGADPPAMLEAMEASTKTVVVYSL